MLKKLNYLTKPSAVTETHFACGTQGRSLVDHITDLEINYTTIFK